MGNMMQSHVITHHFLLLQGNLRELILKPLFLAPVATFSHIPVPVVYLDGGPPPFALRIVVSLDSYIDSIIMYWKETTTPSVAYWCESLSVLDLSPVDGDANWLER